jgi:hypothetical protein
MFLLAVPFGMSLLPTTKVASWDCHQDNSCPTKGTVRPSTDITDFSNGPGVRQLTVAGTQAPVSVNTASKLVPTNIGSDIENYIRSKAWNASIALAVAKAESGLNPNAIDYGDAKFGPTFSPSFGVFQLHWYEANWTSYKQNVDDAYKLWQERGFQPWSTFQSGVYKAYLTR